MPGVPRRDVTETCGLWFGFVGDDVEKFPDVDFADPAVCAVKRARDLDCGSRILEPIYPPPSNISQWHY